MKDTCLEEEVFGRRGHTLPVRSGHWVSVLEALKYDRNLKHKLTTKYQMFLAI